MILLAVILYKMFISISVAMLFLQGTIVMSEKSVLELFPGFQQLQNDIRQLKTNFGKLQNDFHQFKQMTELGCQISASGQEYRGHIAKTKSGKTCQRWDSQNPHKHVNGKRFPGPASGHANYCRNPDNEKGGPWCYTTDPQKRWEFCNIPWC